MSTSESLDAAAREIIEAINRWLEAFHTPLLVAIDGRSGTGKSTIAEVVARSFGAAVLHSDDFYAAEISNSEWDARSGAERARDGIDWVRLRREALLPLLDGNAASWHRFDFEGGPRSDGTYAVSPVPVRLEPRPIILMEGAYAARPELADLTGLTVLIEAPGPVRLARLAGREDPAILAEWQRRWAPAERHYFDGVRPPRSFDLVVQNP